MMRQRYGRIVNISSVVGLHGNAGQANYAASKAGLIGLTKSLAKEYAARGVTVNAVAPGFIATDMTDAMTDAAKTATLAAIPAGRVGRPEEVAAAVAFLASPRRGLRHRPGAVRRRRHGHVRPKREMRRCDSGFPAGCAFLFSDS